MSNESEVRIVKLDPLRVASAYGFGKEPETQAWAKLEAWAKPQGFFDDPEAHRIFGFNNPNPSPSSPNYGYEFWIEVGPEVEPEGDIRIQEFEGGLYAVNTCAVRGDPGEVIPAAWKQLVAWRENSEYRSGHHQWLEKHVSVDKPGVDFVLELYLPIVE